MLRTVGGTPQIAKVYRTMYVEPFCVRTGPNERYLSGRRVMPGESLNLRVLAREADGKWMVHSR